MHRHAEVHSGDGGAGLHLEPDCRHGPTLAYVFVSDDQHEHHANSETVSTSGLLFGSSHSFRGDGAFLLQNLA